MFWQKKKDIPNPVFREYKFSELNLGEIYHAEGILPQYAGRSVKHLVTCHDLRELERIKQDPTRYAEAKRLGVSLHVEPGFGQGARNKELVQFVYRAERRALIKQLIWDLFLSLDETHCIKIAVHNGAYTSTLLHMNINFEAAKIPPGFIKQQVISSPKGDQWVGINIKTMRLLSRLLVAPYEEAMRLRDPDSDDSTVTLNAMELLTAGNIWTQQYWLTALIKAYSSFTEVR